MLSWFPVDIHVRNDPKVRAVRVQYGAAGLGHLLGLWSYIATEGSKTDPGVGLDSAGLPLNLDVMAADLDFPHLESFQTFLTALAKLGLIDADAWANQGLVILPAMRKRLAVYQKSKGRKPTGRPPGRPRKTQDPGIQDPKTPDPGFGVQGPRSGNAQENQGTSPAEIGDLSKEITRPETLGNSGETPGNSGKSYSVVSSILPDLQLEPDHDQDDDPRNGKLTVKKLVRLWNERRQPGPKVMGVVPARYERLRLAIKATPNVADWERAIDFLNSVAWANAPGGDGPHANFRADLDYLAKPGNVTKSLERLAAKGLPTARPVRHTGRVAPTAGKFQAVLDAQKAEDAAIQKAGTP